MGRHVFYTKITPLPSNVPRLLALDLLHSHDEFIRLNPLVTNVKPIDAPRTAEGDEYFSNWYEISEIMKVTGVKVKYDFKGCFHNQSWGMQSHVFAPLGIEFRNKYRVGGNQPGEPREDRELGVNTPQEGLYLREDISFTCNAFMANFVKKGMQDASQVMIDRMKRKAELLDEGKLHAMFENGMLKTSKPRQSAPAPMMEGETNVPSPISENSPGSPPTQFDSPKPQQNDTFVKPGYQNYNALAGRQSTIRESYIPYQQLGYADSVRSSRPTSDVQSHPGSGQPEQGQFFSELPGSYYHAQQTSSMHPAPLKPGAPTAFRSELPGDTSYYPNTPPAVHPAYQQRTSPQPSPRLPVTTNRQSSTTATSPQPSPRLPVTTNRQSSTTATSSARSSNYQVANPDDSQQRSSSVNEWQRNVQSDPPIDENHYRNSRNSHGMGGNGSSYGSGVSDITPDHQRMSNLSIQQSGGGANDRESLPSQRPTSSTAQTQKCPVCFAFEGDEPAVDHHMTKAHGMR